MLQSLVTLFLYDRSYYLLYAELLKIKTLPFKLFALIHYDKVAGHSRPSAVEQMNVDSFVFIRTVIPCLYGGRLFSVTGVE